MDNKQYWIIYKNGTFSSTKYARNYRYLAKRLGVLALYHGTKQGAQNWCLENL